MGENPTFRLPDQTVWTFAREVLGGITQLTAAETTQLNKLTEELKEKNAELSVMNNRFKKEEVPELVFEIIETEEENEDKIVKRKTLDIKPMDEEEAILQMELLDHDFFVFNNVNEGCISVLYKRKDGNYGIIETN